MFHSLEHSYASVLTNHADVKGKNEEDKCAFFSLSLSCQNCRMDVLNQNLNCLT
jgi:hypothetical protein